MAIISGSIKKLIFYKEENGYTVASLLVEDKKSLSVLLKNKSLSNEVTIVGTFTRTPIEEEYYEFEGDFITNPNYGLQFAFKKITKKTINSRYGLINYLSSDLFPGIGEQTAKKIVEELGLNVIDLIKQDPFILDKLKLTPAQKNSIIAGIVNDTEVQDTTIFLLDNGMTLDMSNRIITAMKDENITDFIKTIKENPYKLIDFVERFGFKKADMLALNIGIKKNDPIRIKALLQFVLEKELNTRGDSYLEYDEFYKAVSNEIQENLDHNLFDKYIYEEHDNHHLYIERDTLHVFDYYGYVNEIELAKSLAQLLKNNNIKKYSSEEIDKAFKTITNKTNIQYNDEQITAIKKAFTEPIVIITGGPGTGKTTIIDAVIKMYQKLNLNNDLWTNQIALVAPTGRAAKRLNEATKHDAMTIHKFLGYSGQGFEFNRFNKTKEKLIIVDEASMMDLLLASNLICSMADDARIIIVGDVDQLPSVGPGQVLKDLIDSKEITTIRLNKIHRQTEGSTIISLAHDMNEGFLPDDILKTTKDRSFFQTKQEVLPTKVVEIFKKALEKGYSLKDIQVLIPMYQVGCGINQMNVLLQDLVNPQSDAPEYKSGLRTFRIYDKVIQLVNRVDKKIMNGDIGYINEFIYKDNSKDIKGFIVKYDGDEVEYNIDELDEIAHAYAISIHKSQGSEFKVVIIPFDSRHFRMLRRKLIYTAVTRCKEKLLLVGDVNVCQRGIGYIEPERRTILKYKFKEFLEGPKNIKDILAKLDKEEKTVTDIVDIGEEEIDIFDN